AGNSDNQMYSPHHMSADSDARPYVADSGNNRVVIFDQINNLPNTGAHVAQFLQDVTAPEGLFVNQITGELWVTNNNSDKLTVQKFPKFDTLQYNPASIGQVVAPFFTLAVV